jgi:hypothetical protein
VAALAALGALACELLLLLGSVCFAGGLELTVDSAAAIAEATAALYWTVVVALPAS